MLIDHHLLQLSEKFLPAVDRSKYGDPQPDITQRERKRNLGILTPKDRWAVFAKSLPLRAQGTLLKRRLKEFKSLGK